MYYPNIITIYGDSRNIGKTTLACRLIEKLAEKLNIIGIKISPHFHPLSETPNKIFYSDNCQIVEEYKSEGNKDSSRMLNAGADKVYYIQTYDANIPVVEQNLFSNIARNIPVICESGGLLDFIIPGISIFIKSMEYGISKFPKEGSIVIHSRNGKPVLDINRISFTDNKWYINN